MSDWSSRDIAKFKMLAIPPSFIFQIAWTFYYLFSPIPMEFVSCNAPDLAGLQDSTLDTKDNVSEKKNRVTRKNGLCSQLNAADK